MAERIAWGDRIFGGSKSGKIALSYPAYRLLSTSPTPDGVVHKLASVFDVRLSPERRAVLVSAATKASGGTVTPENATKTAATVAHLMFAAPEFQFC